MTTIVSVIIATYKRDQSLANALESLAKQTYKDFEVIVIDDNADSGWNKKVEGIVDSFKAVLNVNYIRNLSNQGSAKTRNIGIDKAKGKYITFLDDDDSYLPNKIEAQLKRMVDCDADYSLMNLALFNEDETLSEIRERHYLLTSEAENLTLCHLKYHMTGTDTMMFKKEYLVSFGGFEAIDVGDEFYLMMKAIEHKGKFVYCNVCEVKAYVHTGEGGLSSGQQKIVGEKRLYAFKKRYFSGLSPKDLRYIRMRHYAVLAFAFKRMGKMLRFLTNGVMAVLVAPIQSLQLLKSIKG